MENITLGQISGILIFIVTLIGSVEVILARMKKATEKILQPMNNKIDNLEKTMNEKIDGVELENDKNFLVDFLNRIEHEQEVNEVMYERFYETFERYTNKGHNGYIKARVERFQKEGKLK